MFFTRAGRVGLSTLGLWIVSAVVLSSVALADAVVTVNVRDAGGRPADGKVTLTADAGGQVFSCQTQNGTCQIPKVPGGNYKASVVPNGSTQATAPRGVMIPPVGKVSLIVSTATAP